MVKDRVLMNVENTHSLTGTNSNTICRLIDVRFNKITRLSRYSIGPIRGRHECQIETTTRRVLGLYPCPRAPSASVRPSVRPQGSAPTHKVEAQLSCALLSLSSLTPLSDQKSRPSSASRLFTELLFTADALTFP